jgi:hypothetical protein
MQGGTESGIIPQRRPLAEAEPDESLPADYRALAMDFPRTAHRIDPVERPRTEGECG